MERESGLSHKCLNKFLWKFVMTIWCKRLTLCLVRKIEERKIGCGWKARKPKIVPQFGSREQLQRKESNVRPMPKNLYALLGREKLRNNHFLCEKSKIPPTYIVFLFTFYYFFFLYIGYSYITRLSSLYFFNSLFHFSMAYNWTTHT